MKPSLGFIPQAQRPDTSPSARNDVTMLAAGLRIHDTRMAPFRNRRDILPAAKKHKSGNRRR